MDWTKDIKPGDIVLYKNGDRYELGRVKRLAEDGNAAFIWYSDGETASRTPFDTLVKLENAYAVTATSLGGEDAERMSGTKDAAGKGLEGEWDLEALMDAIRASTAGGTVPVIMSRDVKGTEHALFAAMEKAGISAVAVHCGRLKGRADAGRTLRSIASVAQKGPGKETVLLIDGAESAEDGIRREISYAAAWRAAGGLAMPGNLHMAFLCPNESSCDEIDPSAGISWNIIRPDGIQE